MNVSDVRPLVSTSFSEAVVLEGYLHVTIS